ncbi:hypothetical protein HDU87_007931 [Geranomyces variabilis]|uniref:Uncharacterized protein n=1 Tax=Geranomyces variabilis TaxID=109894 RepID=A0AAD5TFV7_9FUNG|nr:hypothetical protein HDU87_007931 [Geranomyces variabilis]
MATAAEPTTSAAAAGGAAIENVMWSTAMDVHAAPPPAQTNVPSALAEQDESGGADPDSAGNAENKSAASKADNSGGGDSKAGSTAATKKPAQTATAPSTAAAQPAAIENIMWATTMDVHHDAPVAATARPAAVGEEDESEASGRQPKDKAAEPADHHDPASAAAEVRRLDKESVSDAADAKKAKEARDANNKTAGGGTAKPGAGAHAAGGKAQKHRATVTHPIVKSKRDTHHRDVKIVVRLPTDTSTTVPVVHRGGKDGNAADAADAATAAAITGSGADAITNIVQPAAESGGARTNKQPTKREAAAVEAARKLKARKAAAAAKRAAAAAEKARQQQESQAEQDAAAAAAAGTSDSEGGRQGRRSPSRGGAVIDEASYVHRHFHNLHPTTNKLVGVKWDAANRRIHARRLNNIKSTIDTSAPKTYSHLEYKKKTLQLAMERQAQIDRDNDILLEKMASIMKMEQKQQEQITTPMRFAHSLHASKRARDCAQIDKDNLAILHRLETRESFYPHADHLAFRHQSLHYLTNIATYPKRFLHEEAVYEVLERTHTATHDPGLGYARHAEMVRDWTTPSASNYVPRIALAAGSSAERVAAAAAAVGGGGGSGTAPHRHHDQEMQKEKPEGTTDASSNPRTLAGETDKKSLEKAASKDQLQKGAKDGEKTPPLLPSIPTPTKTEREPPPPAEPVVLPAMVAV